jgi:hypothetical protein
MRAQYSLSDPLLTHLVQLIMELDRINGSLLTFSLDGIYHAMGTDTLDQIDFLFAHFTTSLQM